MRVILILMACVCFLGAADRGRDRSNLLALGLAIWCASTLL